MAHAFDPGYSKQPFAGLCQSYPDETVYPFASFRVEWGPVFHRGRLDGSARVLVIGQDPAQHETVVRRILVGEAGHRTQGFLAKLGIDQSYAIINTFLYSAYNQPAAAAHVVDPALAAYRHQWFDALLVGSQIEAVVALGNMADTAWHAWKATPAGAASAVTYHKITHPTAPRTPADLVALLQNWNAGLQTLRAAIQHPDAVRPLVLYGTTFQPNELPEIPEVDCPPGTPKWMRTADGWAAREGADAQTKRVTIKVTVPAGVVP
jgi:uracil-DNA glycosylase